MIYLKTENKSLYIYTDFDWGSDIDTYKLTTRYFAKLANGLIIWHSHYQKTVALSFTQAKYIAIY